MAKQQFQGYNTPMQKSGESNFSPNEEFKNANFNKEWIIHGADNKLPDFAERMGKYMVRNKMTTSKIRSFFGEIKRIQMGGFEKNKSSFYLLRPKIAYAAGRDSNDGLKLFKKVVDETVAYVNSEETFNHFCDLMEAIIAYHKAYGGKE